MGIFIVFSQKLISKFGLIIDTMDLVQFISHIFNNSTFIITN